MAAPSGTVWGSVQGGYGRIGLCVKQTNTDTKSNVVIEVWFWSKYSVSDTDNTLYFDNLSSAGSAKTSRGAISISTTVDTGEGWSTSNQKLLKSSSTYEYTRGTSDATRYIYAKLTDVDRVGATMTVSTTVKIPKLASYTVSYNANGGSGAPGSQTKYYGKTLTLSSTKPIRSGYTFVGWGTSATDTSANYSTGGSYTENSKITLYAIWKKTITLTYNPNGGSGAPSAQSATVYNATTSKTFTLSTTEPKRTGYTFLGWSKSSTATSASYSAGGSCTLSSSDILYAVWKANTYKITYNPNGGSDAPSAQTKTYGVNLILSAKKPTRTNYKFLGWSTSSTATSATYSAGGNFTTNITNNVTLYAVWELAYTKPKISSFSVVRDSAGTSAVVKFNWETFSQTPTITIKWENKSKTVDGLTGTSGSVNTNIGDGSLSPTTTYTIQVVIEDDGGGNSVIKSLFGGTFPIDVLKEGKGVAFGQEATLADFADFAFQTRHRKDVLFDNNIDITGIDPNGNVKNVFIPQNQHGNTIIGYDNWAKHEDENARGNTHVYGYDIVHYISNVANPTRSSGSYRPYKRRLDTQSITINTAGYVTNSCKDVRFWIPFSVPIIGDPKVTVNGTLTLRQGGNYTHGSSASTPISPDRFEVTHTAYNGIYVNAEFDNATSETSNATNNDTVGILFKGTIEFS